MPGTTTTQGNTVLALLRVGRSYAEAAESAGLTVRHVMELWARERFRQ
jgi:hypothetical protein